jgi:hypothetical protein
MDDLNAGNKTAEHGVHSNFVLWEIDLIWQYGDGKFFPRQTLSYFLFASKLVGLSVCHSRQFLFSCQRNVAYYGNIPLCGNKSAVPFG